jgi:ribosomal protein S18 acetylase RimI-like enzyme
MAAMPGERGGLALVSMGEIQVREALAGEYEDLGRLIQCAYAEYARPGDPSWDGYFSMLADVTGRAAFATVLVAVAGGNVVGTATVELDKTIEGTQDLKPGQANFRLLAVDPPARGHGAGRRLVQACIHLARTAGKDVATLHTTDQMAAAQRIYRFLGFERDPPRDIELSPDLVLKAFRLPLRKFMPQLDSVRCEVGGWRGTS